MKQYNLLEIVQSVLDSTDYDNVSDIAETDEAEQVVSLAKDVFFALATSKDWKHRQGFGQLTALGDVTRPSHMKFPDGVQDVQGISYDKRLEAGDKKLFLPVSYIEDVFEFIDICNARDSTSTEVDTVSDFGGATLLIRNNLHPTYWTTFDDVYVVFDSYYSDLDTSLQQSKTQVIYKIAPAWTPTNGFIPDMPGKMFPAYLEKIKAIAHADMKQQPSAIHEQEMSNLFGNLTVRSNKVTNPRGNKRKPSYGRK